MCSRKADMKEPLLNSLSIEIDQKSEPQNPSPIDNKNFSSSNSWSDTFRRITQSAQHYKPKIYKAFSVMATAALGAVSIWGMIETTKKDEDLNMATLMVLNGLACGASIGYSLYKYAPPSVKKAHEVFERFNMEEIVLQNVIYTMLIDSTGYIPARRMLYLWDSIRAGMMLLESVIKFKRPTRSNVVNVINGGFRELLNCNRIYLFKVLTASGASVASVVCLLSGIMGLNLLGDRGWQMPTIIINDTGLLIFGGMAGYFTERLFPNDAVINKASRLLFSMAVSPGGEWQNWLRQGILGLMVGYNYAAMNRQLEERRNTVVAQALQAQGMCNQSPELFEVIRRNIATDDKERQETFYVKHYLKYIDKVVAVVPSFFGLIAKDNNLALIFGLAGGFYILSRYATERFSLSSYEHSLVNTSTLRRAANYILNENPLWMAIVYTYSIKLGVRLDNQFGLYSYPANWIIVPIYYTWFGILAGMVRGNRFRLPYVEEHLIGQLQQLIRGDAERVDLSIWDQRYLLSLVNQGAGPNHQENRVDHKQQAAAENAAVVVNVDAKVDAKSDVKVDVKSPEHKPIVDDQKRASNFRDNPVAFFAARIRTVIKPDQEEMAANSMIRDAIRSSNPISITFRAIPYISFEEVFSLKP